MPSFYVISTVAAVICFVLAIVWLLVPQRLLSIWGIAYSSSVGLVSRRGAALFLAIGVMLFLARSLGPSQSRAALSAGFIVGCLSLAGLGIFEFVKKRANAVILSAVLVEILLAIAFMLQM